jgi:hypothetical protein
MIANFRLTPFHEEIVYYYPKREKTLPEQMLALLPPNFRRHTKKECGISYIPFSHEYPWDPMIKQNLVDSVLEQDYHFLRILYSPHCKPLVPSKRLYISRNKDSDHYRIQNEEELLKVLVPLGFQVVTMSELKVVDQMGELSSCDVIVAPHGAGLTYSMFCEPTVTIVEIAPRGVRHKRHFAHIAWALNFEYYRSWSKEYYEDTKNIVADVAGIERYLLCHPKFEEDVKKRFF